jgi:hypothetical protein
MKCKLWCSLIAALSVTTVGAATGAVAQAPDIDAVKEEWRQIEPVFRQIRDIDLAPGGKYKERHVGGIVIRKKEQQICDGEPEETNQQMHECARIARALSAARVLVEAERYYMKACALMGGVDRPYQNYCKDWANSLVRAGNVLRARAVLSESPVCEQNPSCRAELSESYIRDTPTDATYGKAQLSSDCRRGEGPSCVKARGYDDVPVDEASAQAAMSRAREERTSRYEA